MIVIRRPLQSSSSSSRSGWCSQMQRPVSACRRIGVNIAAPPEPLRSFDQCSTEGSEENLNRRQQRKQRLILGLGFRDRHSALSNRPRPRVLDGAAKCSSPCQHAGESASILPRRPSRFDQCLTEGSEENFEQKAAKETKAN